MFCNIIGHATELELGVAVEPMKLIIHPGKMTYFTVINETDREYIVTAKVVSDAEADGYKYDKRFVYNPPLKFLKKREHSIMGVVYLQGDEPLQDQRKYYLSISFIPRVSKNKEGVSIPVILIHQIPLVLE